MAYQQIGPQQSAAGIEPRVVSLPEAASVTALAGAPVVRNAAGFIEECADDPTEFLGFLAEDGHDDAAAGTHSIQVHLARGKAQFDGVLKTAALTQTMAGETAGLKKGADGIWYFDQTAVNPTVNIEGWSSRVAIGDTDPVVEVTPLAAAVTEE